MHYKKFIYLIIGLFVYWIILPQTVAAEGEFFTDYTVSYAIAPSGSTVVTQMVTLTNKLTNLYPKEYAITIDSLRISNIIAKDDAGNISPAISQSDGKTDIKLVFNQEVVGAGKQLSFTLRYESADFAQKNGSIWEINIPGVENDESLRTYNVTLQVPSSFGPNAYTAPLPADGRVWTKAQMTNGGISAAYGDKQTFALSLSYFLTNNGITPSIQEIALPSDTAYQRVVVKSIEPKPVTVTHDQDGNWLAQYELLAGSRMNIKAQLLVDIMISPRPDFSDHLENSDVYIKPLPYWDVENAHIQALSREYTTPRKIYDYVVKTLSYNYERINTSPKRQGTVHALEAPADALCMEFTDVFITMARAAGIPAREVVGFAYTNNPKLRPLSLVSDVLHAWPEYYDKEVKRWIPVDPTWGNTTGGVNYFDKLDFNHIVFATRGIHSDYPYPAGSYRQEGRSGKDVLVEFADSMPVPSPKTAVFFHFPTDIFAGFPLSGSIDIENINGTSISVADVTIEIPGQNYFSQDVLYNMPPFAKVSYPIRYSTISNLVFGTFDQIRVSVNGEVFLHSFRIRSIAWFLVGIIFLIGVIGAIYIRLQKRGWRRHD